MGAALSTCLLAASFGLCLSLQASAVHADDVAAKPQLTFDILFAEEGNARSADQLQWSPSGDRLAYTWSDSEAEDSGLWILTPQSGKRVRVGSVTDLLGEKEEPETSEEGGTTAEDEGAGHAHGAHGENAEGFGSLEWHPSGASILFTARGGLHHVFVAGGSDGGKVAPLLESTEDLSDIEISPTGRKISFLRDLELWVRDLESGEEKALTEGAVADVIINAQTDWVYWEEIYGRNSTAYWWSPDGEKIAYYQFDEEPVGQYPLVNFLTVYPEIEWQSYPKAGTDNPRVKVGVVDVSTAETQWLDTASDEETYMARVGWAEHDGSVMVQRLNREQDRLDLLRCQPENGECGTLITETHSTWVNLENDYRYLEDGKILWGSERSGWRRLYLYSSNGELLRPVTPEGWNVSSLDAVLADGSILFSAYSSENLGAWHRSVHRSILSTGESELLAGDAGWNSATAGEGGYWIHRWSDANTPPQVAVKNLEGRTMADLPTQETSLFSAEKLPPAEFFSIPGPDDSRLPATLVKPLNFDSAKSYPVVMYHYGGPDSQVVRNAWGSRGRGLWHKMMAERGYVVLSVDNQASTFFGKKGEDLVHRRFGEVNLAAQLAAVDYLKTLDYVDSNRIGLWGWSGGGSNTLYCLTNAPGTWRAGMSGAPVTDWYLYDTIWTERYLDHPEDNEEGYRDSSAITHAEKLEDALLIIHGTADDNVHPANTIAYSKKLIDAGIPFEEGIYPRQKHGFRGKASRHFYEKMTGFFDRELAPAPAPEIQSEAEPLGR